MYLAEPDLALGHGAADRRRDHRLGIHLPRVLERADVGVALAQDAQAVAHGGERDLGAAEVALGAGQIDLGLLPILERAGLGIVQRVLPLLVGLRQSELRARFVERGRGGDEVVLPLHELRSGNRQQRRAALDPVAGLGEELGDAAGIGREDRRGHIIVDGDLAVRHPLRAEDDLAHRRDLEARPLRVRRAEGARRLGRRRRLLARREMAAQTRRHDKEQQRDQRRRAEQGELRPARQGAGRWGQRRVQPVMHARQTPDKGWRKATGAGAAGAGTGFYRVSSLREADTPSGRAISS